MISIHINLDRFFCKFSRGNLKTKDNFIFFSLWDAEIHSVLKYIQYWEFCFSYNVLTFTSNFQHFTYSRINIIGYFNQEKENLAPSRIFFRVVKDSNSLVQQIQSSGWSSDYICWTSAAWCIWNSKRLRGQWSKS